jgi:hypothetical protein
MLMRGGLVERLRRRVVREGHGTVVIVVRGLDWCKL